MNGWEWMCRCGLVTKETAGKGVNPFCLVGVHYKGCGDCLFLGSILSPLCLSGRNKNCDSIFRDVCVLETDLAKNTCPVFKPIV